jgi:hypothetical protein
MCCVLMALADQHPLLYDRAAGYKPVATGADSFHALWFVGSVLLYSPRASGGKCEVLCSNLQVTVLSSIPVDLIHC